MVERKAPLSLLAELAQGRRDDAGRVLARSLALLKDSEARLAMLESYRNEYRRRYAANGKTGIAPHELRNFRDFLERLDKAIAQQRAEAESLARAAGESRRQWLAEHARGRSMEVLVGRAERVEHAGNERRLQKLLDEFSARLSPQPQ
jgi:flagellar FliJ protein